MSAEGSYFARMVEKHLANVYPWAVLEDEDPRRTRFWINVTTDEGKKYQLRVDEVV